MDAVLDSVRDAVLVVDTTGKPLFGNAAFRNTFGTVADAPRFAALRDAADRPIPWEEALLQRTARGETFALELALAAAADPERWPERWFDVRGQPRTDNAGRAAGGVLLLRETTEERRLRDENRGLRDAFALAPIGLAMLDLSGRYRRANRAYCALLGRDEGQLRTTDYLAFAAPDDRAPYRESLRLLQSGALAGTAVAQRGRAETGAERRVIGQLVAVRDERGRPDSLLLAAHEDSSSGLRQARKEFSVAVAHDLRTPLTVIQAGLGLLSSSATARLVAQERELLDNLGRNTLRLKARIDELLALQQPKVAANRAATATFDLRTVVQAAAATIRRLLDRREQSLTVELGRPLPVSGDEEQLARAFTGLLYAVQGASPTRAHLRIRGESGGGMVRVRIDTAAGMTPLDRDDRELRMVRGIIDLHGGHLHATAPGTPATGGSFTISLPDAGGYVSPRPQTLTTEDGHGTATVDR